MRLTKESELLNKVIFKKEFNVLEIKSLQKFIIENNIDILSLTIDINLYSNVSKIDQLSFKHLVSQFITIYSGIITTPNSLPISKNYKIRSLDQEEIKAIAQLLDFSFTESEYDLNPYVDKENILKLHLSDLFEYSKSNNLEKECLMIEKNNTAISIVLVDHNNKLCTLKEVTNNIDYQAILSITNTYLKGKGVEKIYFQVSQKNQSLANALINTNYTIKKSYVLVHVNPMLSYSCIEPLDYAFNISDDDIKKYGEVSGDLNPIHFSDKAAQSAGFKSRIAHGLISNAIMSKYFGTIFPGEGSIFINYNYLFLQPIYPNVNYSVEITFPTYKEKIGWYLALVKIRDENGKLCLLSYNGLIKR